MAGRGGTVLFVGTKKQARDTVAEAAEAGGMPYIHQRWLGGLLTNFQTVNKRIKRLHELTDWTENGTLDLLPTRERIAAEKERAKLEYNLGGVRDMQRPPDAHVRGGPEDRGDRRARGRAPEDPDHRARRHQLRPGPGHLRDPRQRRRDPLLQGDRGGDRRRGGRAERAASAPRRRPRAASARSRSARRRRSGSARRPRRPPAARPRSRPARRPRRRARRRPRPPEPRRRARPRHRAAHLRPQRGDWSEARSRPSR